MKYSKSHNQFILFFIITLGVILFNACEESRVYDKNSAVHKSGWSYDEAKTFEVNITDISSTYNLFMNIRHTDKYPYNNIWLKIITIHPDSSQQQGRINVQLSEPGGRWTGNCTDGVCFNSVLIQQNFKFEQTGKYIFKIQQDMRLNPLPSILHVGLKIEKFQ